MDDANFDAPGDERWNELTPLAPRASERQTLVVLLIVTVVFVGTVVFAIYRLHQEQHPYLEEWRFYAGLAAGPLLFIGMLAAVHSTKSNKTGEAVLILALVIPLLPVVLLVSMAGVFGGLLGALGGLPLLLCWSRFAQRKFRVVLLADSVLPTPGQAVRLGWQVEGKLDSIHSIELVAFKYELVERHADHGNPGSRTDSLMASESLVTTDDPAHFGAAALTCTVPASLSLGKRQRIDLMLRARRGFRGVVAAQAPWNPRASKNWPPGRRSRRRR